MARGRPWRVAALALGALMASAAPVMASATTAGAPLGGPESLAYSAAILADAPSMYWRLGDVTGGAAIDESGSGRNGNYHGVSLGLPGAIVDDSDTSAGFDGQDDFMLWKPGSLTYRGPFSVESWVLPDMASREHDFFSTRRGYLVRDFSFHIKLSTRGGVRGVRVGVGDGTNWFVNATIPFQWTANVWYDMVAVADVTGVTVYVDGVSIGTLAYDGSPLLYNSAHPVSIGQVGYGREWFAGQIDEVSVYEYPLSPEQIAAHYIAATAP